MEKLQQLVPAEQSKEHFVELADSHEALLTELNNMAMKICCTNSSTAAQRQVCFDSLSHAYQIYTKITEKLGKHYSSYYTDVEVLLAQLNSRYNRASFHTMNSRFFVLRKMFSKQETLCDPAAKENANLSSQQRV